jgi:hypothetical protein
MLSKSFAAPILLLVLTSSANAQAIIAPALGVNGSPRIGDARRPSADKPCGNVTISQDLDSSTPVVVHSSGTFSPSITNFVPRVLRPHLFVTNERMS